MKKIIISGSSGQIGNQLLDILIDTDYEIYALTTDLNKLSKYKHKNVIAMLNNDFLKSELDLNDSIFINLAFPRRNDINLINSALEMTRNMYKKLKKNKCKKLINISSQSIYDKDRTKPANEDDYPIPFNLYGYAKFYFEKFTEEYSKDNNIDFINLRLASVVGPNTDVRINNILISKYMNDEDIEINLNKQRYSYIDIIDVARALKDIIDQPNRLDWNTSYNLGSHYYYSESEIFDSIKRNIEHDYKGNLIYVKNDISITNQLSLDKLFSKISWRPVMDIDEINKNIILKNKKKGNI